MCNSTGLKASGVFVDLENMANGQKGNHFDICKIMACVGKISAPVLRKAYGDWGRFAKHRTDFTSEAFDMIHYASMVSGKNGLDIQMTVDVLEAIFLLPHIATVFLLTGDSDYCPLVRILHKYERRVIGIGWSESTGKLFRRHCDDFWSCDEIAALPDNEQKWMNSKAINLLLGQVAEDLDLEPNDWVRMSTLKQAMLQRDPAFDEKQHGFSGFSQFVNAHPDLHSKFSQEISDYFVQLPGSTGVRRNGKH